MKTFVCRCGLILTMAAMVSCTSAPDVDPRMKLAEEKGAQMTKVVIAVAKKDFDAANKAIHAFYGDDKCEAARRLVNISWIIDREDKQRPEWWLNEELRLIAERNNSRKPPGGVATAMKPGGDPRVVWLEVYDDAMALANKEKKPLLIDFSGSDWNPASQALHRDTFWSERFAREIAPKFILLSIDFPRYRQMTQKMGEQNDRLFVRYAVAAEAPAVLVVDSVDGAAYARFSGYVLRQPDAFIDCVLAASNNPEAKRREKEADQERLRNYRIMMKADQEARRKGIEEKNRLAAARQASAKRQLDDAVPRKDFEAAAKAIDELQGSTKSEAASHKAKVSLLIDSKDKARALKYMDEAIVLDGGMYYASLRNLRDNIANGTTPVQVGLKMEDFVAAYDEIRKAKLGKDFERACAVVDKVAAGNKSHAFYCKAELSLEFDPKDKARALKLMDEAIANSDDYYKPYLQLEREEVEAGRKIKGRNLAEPQMGFRLNFP